MAAIIRGGRLGGDGGASVWVAKAGTAGRVVGSERGIGPGPRESLGAPGGLLLHELGHPLLEPLAGLGRASLDVHPAILELHQIHLLHELRRLQA